jgi:UDP-glucuronate 4-epimerase
MRAVVTGCAGFIGSHLAEALVSDGATVTGIDAFTPYYGRADKEENLRGLADEAGFDLAEADLARQDLAPLVRGADVVFHLAAQPGVRDSFLDFERYTVDNMLATQRLFAAARAASVPRVVWASSSSVYGDATDYPCGEDAATRPRSPYGVTKRACEDLAAIYRGQGLETVGLRYFTVYGPRQRPDMAMRRLCEALCGGEVFPLLGGGDQSRDFTYVGDAVDATVRAGAVPEPRDIYNVGGGEEATLAAVIARLESLAGRPVPIESHGVATGDVRRTAADTSRARRDLGWTPAVTLADGLARELAWVKGRAAALRG